jgi:O-antigen ligase
LIALLRFPFNKQLKIALVLFVLLGGLSGFVVKYMGFFKKGATSVSARFDYWEAAVHITGEHPVFGTGPGTFAIPYAKIKRPESEMARLTHNDYLEQASDSGIMGFVTYTSFIVIGLFCITKSQRFRQDWVVFSMWLGVLGWALQSLMEFGLYIPALAWTAFFFTGWLLANAQIDSTKSRPPDSLRQQNENPLPQRS